MKKLVTTLCTVAALAVVANVSFAANPVRISQVWSGGGSSTITSTYNVDYVELFNFSGVAVNVSGWTIEYGSATGNWGSSSANIFTFPANTFIQPCKYLLVQLGTPSTGGGPLPVAADFSGTLAMGAAAGKVALFNAVNTNLACGAELPGTLVDKVNWGATANCPEVAPITSGTLGINAGAARNNGGGTDTDNNNNDFTVGLLVPRNSASPANVNCLSVPAMNSTWGQLKTIYR